MQLEEDFLEEMDIRETVCVRRICMERKIKLKTAVIITLFTFVILGTIGMVIGFTFFWRPDDSVNSDPNVQTLVSALSENPKDINQRIELGHAYLKSGKTDEAKNQFDQVLAIEPQNLTALYNRGIIFQKQQQVDAAIEDFTKIIKADPRQVDPTLNLGQLYTERGNYEEAIRNLKTYVSAYALFSSGHMALAKAYELNGLLKEAGGEYKEVLKLDPSSQEAKDGMVRLEKGNK